MAEGDVLASRILHETTELAVLVERTEKAWKQASEKSDQLYLDSVALNLHGFYTGLEKVFEKIAGSIDRSIPEGANWHSELLNQMSLDIPGVRPPVISEGVRQQLDEYRGFRHVVRNVYTYQMNPEKIKPLVKKLRKTMKSVTIELTAFADFLRSQGQ